MDTQSLINVFGGIVLAVGGWLARELWGAVKELRADLRQLEIDLPSNYIRKDEFQDGIKEIKDICRQIFDKVDGLERRKADK
jgi:hypothetical protein